MYLGWTDGGRSCTPESVSCGTSFSEVAIAMYAAQRTRCSTRIAIFFGTSLADYGPLFAVRCSRRII